MTKYYQIQNQNIGIENGCLIIDAVPLASNTLYICCPYGIGDTLYIAALISSYKSYYSTNKKICLIVKETHSFIPDFFNDIDEKFVSNNLVNLLNTYSISTQTWKLENYLYGHFKKSENLTLYSEYNTVFDKCMTSRYKQLVLGIPLTSPLSLPNYHNIRSTHTYPLDKKTIILMPYATSTPLLPMFFWETLANILKHLGYKLYTNVKDSSESAISGTYALSCNLIDIIPISEQCLAIISLRSGICDLLAYANNTLIIINTDQEISTDWDLSQIHKRDGIISLLCTNLESLSFLAGEILSILGISI